MSPERTVLLLTAIVFVALLTTAIATAAADPVARRDTPPVLDDEAGGDADRLQGVLGDAGAQVGGALAHSAELRVIAETAAVPHRKGVFPGREQQLELRSEGIEVGHH